MASAGGQPPRADWADALPLAELSLPRELVTGEAVALDLRPASFASRAVALALDLLALGALLVIAWVLLARFGGGLDAAAGSALARAVTVLAVVGAPVAVETATRGRSLGKAAMGLRVVRVDGGPERFRQALVRGLLAVPELYLMGVIALVASLVDDRGRRLGDLLAGTYVITERTAARPLPPPVMPAALAGWAALADLGSLPEPWVQATRQLLARGAELDPVRRDRLAAELAGQGLGLVQPPPPPGAAPDDVLAALLAERRERDLHRLRAQGQGEQARARQRARRSPVSPAGPQLDEDPWRAPPSSPSQ